MLEVGLCRWVRGIAMFEFMASSILATTLEALVSTGDRSDGGKPRNFGSDSSIMFLGVESFEAECGMLLLGNWTSLKSLVGSPIEVNGLTPSLSRLSNLNISCSSEAII